MKTRMMIAAVMAGCVFCGWSAGSGRAEDKGAEAKVVAAGKVGRVAIGEVAPEIEAVGVDGKAVTLGSLVGKPVVLQFGSLTEPVFRMRVADSEKMAGEYGDKVTFVIVYARESHAADGENAIEANVDAGYGIAKPVNEDERMKLAKLAVVKMKIEKEVLLVDAWSDASSLRYGGYPNMTFVIDEKGKLQAGFAWMDPGKVKGALDAILAGKAVPAEDRGQTQAGTPGQLDFATAAVGMDSYRGGELARVMDHLEMTEKQKAAIYPALGEYLAEGRAFRERMGNGNGGAGNAAGAKTGVAAGPAGKDEAKSPEDFQAALEKLRAAAKKLKTVVKENLSETDSKAVMEALEQGPAKRLFAD